MDLGNIGNQIVEQMPMACALVDTELQYLVANQQWMLQFDLEKGVDGLHLLTTISPDWASICRRCLEQAAPHDEIQSVTDALKYLHWYLRPWHLTSGEVGGLIIYVQEITDHVIAALRETESRFRDTLELAPLAVAIHRQGKIEYVNPTAVQLIGADKATELIGRSLMEFVHPDYHATVLERVQHMREQKGPVQLMQEQFVRIDGAVIEVEVAATHITVGGQTAHMVVFTDITERKHAEQVLLHQKQFLAQIINASPNLIYVKNWEGQLILVNQALAEVYNTTIDALLGKHEREFNPDSVAIQRNENADRQVMETLEPRLIQQEAVIHVATGERRFYQTRKVPIMAEDGSPQVLSVASDISGWKLAEAEREQRLERERTARREAQDAVRLKDMFLATMSHELRTPLNAVIGYLHLLQINRHLDEDGAHMVERAIANSQRLLNLINNILTISYISTGQLQVVATATSLMALVRNLRSKMGPQAIHKGLEFVVDIDESLPDIITHDEHHIEQIITNLTSNAIKFTEQGFVRLFFRRQHNRLIIRVEDSGIGIPDSKRDLIFEDFMQVDGSYTRKHQGAGLGLAIVQRLTTLLEGSVMVDSEVGSGSVFTIDLPLNLQC